MEKILTSLHQSDQDVTEKISEVTLEIEWIKEVLADAGK
jgi:tRNA (adenine22-N1)-methyltransferase